MRPSKIENYMEIAEVIAKRSHDAETKVGAVLINNKSGAIMSTGYNGFVRGAHDDILPNTRPDKYEYILHAEDNLIANAARHGISTENCTLVCTLSPCKHCMRMLVNCGVTEIVAKQLYKDFNDILVMKDINVVVYQSSENGFWYISYETKPTRIL
jgi:dCMP deaminase